MLQSAQMFLARYPGAKVLYEEAASKLWKNGQQRRFASELVSSVAWVLWVFEMSLLGTWTVRTVAPHMLHLKHQNCWPESVFPHHRLPTKPTGCGITHVMLHLYHMLTLAKPGPIAKPQVVYKSKHDASWPVWPDWDERSQDLERLL